MSTILAAVNFLSAVAVRAWPAVSVRQSITPLSIAQINNFTPFTYYASAGYCAPSQTETWNCGVNCKATPNFKPVQSGGDGDAVQYWYVGYDDNLHTVIVAHQGTNPEEILPVITDLDFFLTDLNPTLFPGIGSDIQVHSGFANEQADTATDILAAVEKAMKMYNATSVSVVGHSLGAAIALLDSVYLPLWLPKTTTFQTIGYGLPRVGNQAFADYVDDELYLTHINNREDPIPTVPFPFLGFVHPSGEVHIGDSGDWDSCPGQDNPSTQCIAGDVPDILLGNLADHNGPYNGIEMGC